MDPSMRDPIRDEHGSEPDAGEDPAFDPHAPVVLLEPETGQEFVLDEASAWEHLICTDRGVIVVSGTLTRETWLVLFTLAELRLHACIDASLEGQVSGWRSPSVDAARERLNAIARVARWRTDLRGIPGL